MQMELHSNAHIPDGLLASMTLLSEKPRQGVTSRESALHPGIDERNCTALLGLQFRWSGIVSGTVDAPNNGNQSSWQQKMRQASHYICGKSPGDRVAKSVLTGAGIGAVTGGIGGFVAGEVFGGEVTLGATGFVGAYLGAHVGAAVGAANGLTTGAVLAGICYAGFQYDN
jgi:hypothetical protein